MKNRQGQRRLDVWVDEEVYRQLKVYEALHDLTHEQALNDIFRSAGFMPATNP